MKTIRDVFAEYKKALLSIYDLNESEAITLLATGEITQFSNATIKAYPERKLSAGQINQLNNILTKLQTGMPVQYALGKTEFYGLPLLVNSSVLIPRPETEELVEWILQLVKSFDLIVSSLKPVSNNIVDIGTGSGCIAIILKKYLPDFNVAGIDISADAIQTAKLNGINNDIDIEWIEADILNKKNRSRILNIQSPVSIIVSNPPYVTPTDKRQMQHNVIDFEPHTALFVPQNDPLLFYKAIADFAFINLEQNGLLFFEINESYGKETLDMLRVKGFTNLELRQDMSGRDRMIKAVKKDY